MLSNIVNITLSSLTVLAQIIVIYLAVIILIKKKTHPLLGRPFQWIGRRGMIFAFIVALIAMVGSLTYSDILGYEPCKLCWYQRILMYPLVLLFGMAIWRKENFILPYAMLLSTIGGAIALYHYTVQLGLVAAPCSVSGYSVSCAKVFTMRFGYITIPMMAFSAFMLILFLTMLSNKAQGGETVNETSDRL